MANTKVLICAGLFRLLLPLVLFLATVVRFNLLSFVYGCFLLVEPLLQRPNCRSMSGPTGFYMLALVTWSGLAMLGQLIFQITLLAKADDEHPYGSILPNCSSIESILRNVGFQRLQHHDVLNIGRNTVPDPLVFFTSFSLWFVFRALLRPAANVEEQDCSSASTTVIPTTLTNFRRILGNFVVTLMLAASGIMYPSILSALYFVLFLVIMTWLSCLNTLGNRFAILRCLLLVYSASHLILLYLYQFQFFQNALNPEDQFARLFGLTGVVSVNCQRPWLLEFHDNVDWPVYVNPCIIMLLYFVLSVETRRWFNHGNMLTSSPTAGVSQKKSPHCKRRPSNSEKQELVSSDDDAGRRDYQSVANTDIELQLSESQSVDNEHFSDLFTREKGAIATLYNFVLRQSYAGALIVMMAWSITYHSWLTFVLLLTACLIWLLPQKRSMCFKCMPVILLYAVVLVVIQYIYSLHIEGLKTATAGGYPYSQIGLTKYQYPCLTLASQLAYTCMFWLALRQYKRELRQARENVTSQAEHMELSDNGSRHIRISGSNQVEVRANAFIEVIGTWLWHLLCKYWILICSALFLVMAIQEAVFYRIIYMLFFLYYVLTFQICYRWWRMTIRVFWWVVIVYSMIVVCIIYTYQFQHFPEYWKDWTGFSEKILLDIGLEQFDNATLFVKLLTPTSFLIIIILQLHYFQSEFLFMSNITRDNDELIGRSPDEGNEDEITETENTEALNSQQTYISHTSFYEDIHALLVGCGQRVKSLLDRFSDVLWRFLEVHMFKVISLTSLLIAVNDVCALNVVLIVILTICVPVPLFHRLLSYLSMIWISIAILARMFFQINSISDDFWYSNCTDVKNVPAGEMIPQPFNTSIDSATYMGLEKVDNLPHYLRLYITLLVLLCFEAVVRTHQQQYYQSGHDRPRQGIIFPGIKRNNADDGLVNFFKFMANYAFYTYGLELCMTMTVINMTVRMDAFSVLYGCCLGIVLCLSRRQCIIVWPFYIIVLTLLLFLQYLSCLGIPAALCYEYPWVEIEEISRNLQIFLYLPNYISSPDPHKLILDFLQLLFVCQQWRVFAIEKSTTERELHGGEKSSEEDDSSQLAYDDNFIDVKNSYLDYIKTLVFVYMYWVTLIILFIAGTSRISLFCMGYLIGTFIFLWLGHDLLIKPSKTLLKYWTVILGYCYGVLMFKCALQLVGCVYISKLGGSYCWLVQLFSIVCIHAGSYDAVSDPDGCHIPADDAGMMWDAICFVCLVLQMRIYKSSYFNMVVLELKVQNQLSSRGAELINGRLMAEIEYRKATEENILTGIKKKMEKIKLRQTRLQQRSALLDSDDHYQVIRSGDYFMFEEESDDEVESSLGTDIINLGSDMDDSRDKKLGPFDILNTAWTDGPKEALEKASKKATHKESLSDDSFEEDTSLSSDAISDDVSDQDLSDTAERRGSHGSAMGHVEQDSITTKVETNARLAWAVFGGILDYCIGILQDIAKDHHEVAVILDVEKAKEKKRIREAALQPAQKKDESDDDPDMPKTTTGQSLASDNERLLSREDIEQMKLSEIEFHESTPKLFQLGVYLWDALMSRSAMVCYFMMVLNQLTSASLLSLPYSFSVFLWAMLSVPRPTKTYWITIITYTEALVLVKYLFQFGFFPWNAPDRQQNAEGFDWPQFIGIEKHSNYAAFDLVLLFTLFLHRSVLKRYGLWKDTEEVERDLEKAEEEQKALSRQNTPATTPTAGSSVRFAIASASEKDISDACDESKESSSESLSSLAMKEGPPSRLSMVTKPFKNFYKDMTNPNFNAATDVYSMMFLCDFINFFIIVFGYKSFGPPSGSKDQVVTGLISENKVPLPFLLMVLLQFVLIIGDRALYLRKYVLGKFVYQILLMIGVHVWMFFVLPVITHRPFTENLPAQLWYFVKCIYFGLSAYQIRSGYPTRILGNFLTRKYNYLNLILYKGFLVVPFLLELRILMDWIWTDTTLALTSWLEMEDIFANIFQIKCYRTAEQNYPTRRGKKRSLIVKYGLGGGVLFLLIFIIWFPLLVFSLAHTVLYETNKPIDVTVKIQLGGYEPLFVMSAQQQAIKNMTTEQFNAIQRSYKNEPNALSGIKVEDMSIVEINGSSTSLWTISPPSEQALASNLRDNATSITLYFSVAFTRELRPGMTSDTVSTQFKRELKADVPEDVQTRRQFAKMIENPIPDSVANTTYKVNIIDLFPRYMRVPINDHPKGIPELEKGTERNISFQLLNSQQQSEQWWELQEYDASFPLERGDYWEPYLTFIVISERVAPPSLTFIAGYGIIGLYVSLVLVVGRFVRIFFSGISYNIMFVELPNVDKVLKLCLEVYLAREALELQLEEDLFAKLLFLYRSPETLIKWTKVKVS